MRHLTLLILILACSINVTFAQSTLLFEDFEDATLTFTSSESLFRDGTQDYFTITPLNGSINTENEYSGFGGTNFFAGEDLDDMGSETKSLTFSIDITGYNTLLFSGKFAAGNNDGDPGYDDEESIIVTASIDGGMAENILAFEAAEPGGDITNNLMSVDADFNGVGDGVTLMSNVFTDFTNLPISGTGTTLTLTIDMLSNDGNSELAFDDITILGTPALTGGGTDPIPTMGQWALFILGLLISNVALVFIREKKTLYN